MIKTQVMSGLKSGGITMTLIPRKPTEKRLIVAEIFGPTFQGEGRFLGQSALFLRLGVCNLSCGFCDTKYSWDFANFNYRETTQRLSINHVAGELLDKSGDYDSRFSDREDTIKRLVITGGEPMLQVEKLLRLLGCLPLDWTYEIETAGTIPFILNDWLDGETGIGDSQHFRTPSVHFNISPKLSNSGNDWFKAITYETLDSYLPLVLGKQESFSADFKFIVGHEDPIKDFSEISHLVQYLGIPNNKVFISPMGTTPERIMKVTNRIADLVTYHRWNLTTRLHIIAWGDESGR